MTTTSISFMLFTGLVLAIYYLLNTRAQNYLVLGASLIFIASWDIRFAAFFILLTMVNYLLSFQTVPDAKRPRFALWLAISVNVLALVFFKYNNFFIAEFNGLLGNLGLATLAGGLEFLLPIGLSFYVVQVISYHIDLSRKLIQPTYDWVIFTLYMLYFPKVIAGPIERARDLIPKLEKQRIVDNTVLSRSITLIFMGLFRKIVISDVLTLLMPARVFQEPARFSSPELILWIVVYAVSLYNDFAGYSSIVRGISGLFGIELSLNFNMPYLSRSFAEFWQRWHITLSNWLRDYIFTPSTRAFLGRKFNSQHLYTIIIPSMLTMFVSALWHNLSWNMIVWGGLHGGYLIAERLRQRGRQITPIHLQPVRVQVLSAVVVFALTVLAWIPFRMDLPIAMAYLTRIFTPEAWFGVRNVPMLFWGTLFVLAVALIVISFSLDIFCYRHGEFVFLAHAPLMRAALINAAFFAIALAVAAQVKAPPPFVYQGY